MKESFPPLLDNSIFLLFHIFQRMREIEIELMRVSEVASILMLSGMQESEDTQLLRLDIKKNMNKNSIGEMICCLDFLSFLEEEKDLVDDTIKHILENRNPDGGIGRFIGDRSRIPVCWRVLQALYLNDYPFDKNVESIIRWMEGEWSKDMERGGLSYKCAVVLLANSYYPHFSKDFIEKVINWLLNDQNDDGGWGPRKNSPVGSTPSETALALRALSNYPSEDVNDGIKMGVGWLIKNKLESGFWKEHPPEKPLMHIVLFLNNQLENEIKFH